MSFIESINTRKCNVLDEKVYETWGEFNRDFANGRIGIITYNVSDGVDFNKIATLLARHNINFKIEWKESLDNKYALFIQKVVIIRII